MDNARIVLFGGSWWDYVSDDMPDAVRQELNSALDAAHAALRAQAEREKSPRQTCNGCVDVHAKDGDPNMQCDHCKRLVRTTDCYRRRNDDAGN